MINSEEGFHSVGDSIPTPVASNEDEDEGGEKLEGPIGMGDEIDDDDDDESDVFLGGDPSICWLFVCCFTSP